MGACKPETRVLVASVPAAIQLEDDILTKPDFVTTMMDFAAEKSALALAGRFRFSFQKCFLN
jgi:hypothetical protein